MPLSTRATSFAHLALRPPLQRVLQTQGIVQPTPIQAEAIPILLDGRDVIGQARTGSGKTLAFVLPLAERVDPRVRAVQALILVPTRELAIQVGSVLAEFASASRLRHTLLYGGRSVKSELRGLAGAQIVVGTPGRTLDHLSQRSLDLARVSFLVLDEADEMLDRGFAPSVERILAHTPRSRQTALFSATLPEWVASVAARHVREPVTVAVDSEIVSAPEIEHVVYEVAPEAKLGALRTLLDRRGSMPVIVFGRTKHGVKKLALRLEELGYPTGALQGNLSQNARERVMASFRSGAVPILLATNVAARGLDVPGVGQVINYELPESAEWFTHRVGRTGRMGRDGEAITLITPEDTAKFGLIEKKLGRKLARRSWASSQTAVEAGPVQTSVDSSSTPPRWRQRPRRAAAGATPAGRSRPTRYRRNLHRSGRRGEV